MVGIVTILIMWLLGSLAVVAGAVWFCAAPALRNRPKPPKPAKPPVVKIKTSPPPRPTSPPYLRRWNLQRRWWVVVEKAEWQRQYDRLP